MAEELENQVEGTEQEQTEEEERTFTQAEVDELINKRLARARKGMPTDDELKAFREWQDKQNPEGKAKATHDELELAKMDAEMTRRENYLLRKGVDPDEAEVLSVLISNKYMDGETDFEDAAEKYLKTHKSKIGGVRMDTGARLNGGKAKPANEQMNDLIRNARK